MRRILTLALPIIGGMISQNVLNLVDTAMVGTLGDAALAAVGIGGFATFVSMALVLGVSSGVQAMASRRMGEQRYARMAVPLNAGLLLVIIVAPLLSALLFLIVPAIFPVLIDDPAVIEQGVPYLRIRVLAITFVAINFAFRGYWNGVDRSDLYMKTLVVMHVSNIVLNYILIFGKFGAPALGVRGAGLGTALSTIIGTSMYFFHGSRLANRNGFLHGLPPLSEFLTIVRLSIPAGLQQFFFAAGLLTLFWIVGRVGTAEVAAGSVLVNVTLVAILPGMGFGLAAATLVGQALGRGDPAGARQWGWDVTRVAMLMLGMLGLPMLLFPDAILGVFIREATTVELARAPMRLVGLTMALEGIGLVLMNALLGAGDAKRVMIVSIVAQWLFFLPLAFLLGPVLGFGLLGIWLIQGVYRFAQAAIFASYWRGDRWEGVKL